MSTNRAYAIDAVLYGDPVVTAAGTALYDTYKVDGFGSPVVGLRIWLAGADPSLFKGVSAAFSDFQKNVFHVQLPDACADSPYVEKFFRTLATSFTLYKRSSTSAVQYSEVQLIKENSTGGWATSVHAAGVQLCRVQEAGDCTRGCATCNVCLLMWRCPHGTGTATERSVKAINAICGCACSFGCTLHHDGVDESQVRKRLRTCAIGLYRPRLKLTRPCPTCIGLRMRTCMQSRA